MTPSDKSIERRRIGISLIASIAAHALLAVLIVVAHNDQPLQKKKAPQIMDVVLLDANKSKAPKPPEDAKAISNRSAVGGSSKAQDKLTRAARAPVTGQQQKPRPPAPPSQPKNPPPSPEPQKRPRVLARRGVTPDSSNAPKPPKKQSEKAVQAPPRIPLSNLMPSTMALAQLSRDFQREKRMKQMLSREADVPINTREAKFAPYAQALVRALEEQWRPGKANYEQFPEDARRSLMRVTIENNGDLGGVEILRPSPIPQINESAIQAIHAAAPFRPLPSSWGLDRVSFYLTFEVVEDRFVFHAM
ncbi:MAG TPA: TonB family protein [Mariprofundaceae bacterium]|nr:TonB family protein [Mariprofundaceae bacterium]